MCQYIWFKYGFLLCVRVFGPKFRFLDFILLLLLIFVLNLDFILLPVLYLVQNLDFILLIPVKHLLH